ncbi:hypothetical protein MMC25_000580 [Agyrium rufum]|nr:hypothetical protein [Agyrium rufum]
MWKSLEKKKKDLERQSITRKKEIKVLHSCIREIERRNLEHTQNKPERPMLLRLKPNSTASSQAVIQSIDSFVRLYQANAPESSINNSKHIVRKEMAKHEEEIEDFRRWSTDRTRVNEENYQ